METDTLKKLQEYLRKSGRPLDLESEIRLLQLWDEGASESPSAEGWKAIRRKIRRQVFAYRLKKMSRYAAVIIVAAMTFMGGYLYSSFTEERTGATPQTFVLVTAEGSVGKYELPDGSGVWLNGGSKLVYTGDFATNRRATLTGEAYFDVKHDSEHPFLLTMNNISVEVLGTQFDACCYADGSYEDVILREGSVRVKSADSQKPMAVLEPDMRFIYNLADGSTEQTDVKAANYCSWMQERLVFSNVPLEDIITNLERKYNVEITVASERLKHRRFSLTVSHESFADMTVILNALTATRARFVSDRSLILE